MVISMILLVKSFFSYFHDGPERHRFFLEMRKGDHVFAPME